MGEEYYQLPKSFFKQNGDLFAGLKEEALPFF